MSLALLSVFDRVFYSSSSSSSHSLSTTTTSFVLKKKKNVHPDLGHRRPGALPVPRRLLLPRSRRLRPGLRRHLGSLVRGARGVARRVSDPGVSSALLVESFLLLGEPLLPVRRPGEQVRRRPAGAGRQREEGEGVVCLEGDDGGGRGRERRRRFDIVVATSAAL
jgi:hypothetical protein